MRTAAAREQTHMHESAANTLLPLLQPASHMGCVGCLQLHALQLQECSSLYTPCNESSVRLFRTTDKAVMYKVVAGDKDTWPLTAARESGGATAPLAMTSG